MFTEKGPVCPNCGNTEWDHDVVYVGRESRNVKFNLEDSEYQLGPVCSDEFLFEQESYFNCTECGDEGTALFQDFTESLDD